MTKLSSEQVDWLVEKREAGWSKPRIASELGVSEGAVFYQCLKNGALSPKQRLAITPTQQGSASCFGRTVRTFSRDEDEHLLDLSGRGLRLKQICALTGRAASSVRFRLLMLGLREDMPA